MHIPRTSAIKLMAVSLRSLVVALLAVCCQSTKGPCDSPVALAGRSYRWPKQNPGLVAPVMANYYYQPYKHPMEAELTSTGISITSPPDYHAGFTLTDTSGGSASSEKYQLKSIELRKPGRVPEGSTQVLPHILEVALVHEEITGTGYWATVVLPFDVVADPEHDILSAIVYGSKLPRDIGEIKPVLRSGTQSLNLNLAFTNSSFHAYWSTAKMDCPGSEVPMRQLLRNTSLATVQSTFADLFEALRKVPEAPPLSSPAVTWITSTCPQGATCPAYQGQNINNEYVEALVDQSHSVAELRNRKDLMDQSLVLLQNSTVGSFVTAVTARDNLRDAESQLQTIMAQVSELGAWQSQLQSAAWGSQIPTVNSTSAASTSEAPGVAAGNAAQSAKLLSVAADVSDASSPGGGPGHTAIAAKSKPAHCRAWGRSPANIRTENVTKLAQGSSATGDSLFFRYSEAATSTEELRVGNYGDHLRIAALSNGTGKPLGEVVLHGAVHRVSYIDVHVPGEHAVDGQVPAAELQLVSLPASVDMPAVAVAFPLNEAAGDGNAWLQPLLVARPEVHQVKHVRGASLAELHDALRQGSTERYYRYDGTLTRIPCRSAEWYVLEERGGASGAQLATLLNMLPAATGPSASKKPFEVGLVMEGVQHLAAGAAQLPPSAVAVAAPAALAAPTALATAPATAPVAKPTVRSSLLALARKAARRSKPTGVKRVPM